MRIRYYCFVIYLCLLSSSLNAQMVNGPDTLYGNEWIEASQSYLRIPVASDGFYRISYEAILAQGWPVGSIPASNFQLFHEGQAMTLYNSNESDSPLAAGDYLLFYGHKNRGKFDQHLYRDAELQQLNPEYSLYSDTASYYLTHHSNGSHSFFTTINNDLTALPSPAPFVWQTIQVVHTDNFIKEYYRVSGATLYYSHFSIGEGYGSRSVNELLADGSTEQAYTLALENAYTAGPAPVLETRYTAALFNHIQQLSVNEIPLRLDTFYNWAMMNVTVNLPVSTLTDGEARVQWEGFGGEKDEVSVGYLKIKYPALTTAEGATTYQAVLPANGERQYLEISNFDASSAVVYDMTNGWRIPVAVSEGLLRVALPASTEDRRLHIIASENNLPLSPLNTVNLQLPTLGSANYIILTHSLLRTNGDPVQLYANYRSSMSGGGYQTAVVNTDDLFDQFGYGVQQHPMAIRNFVAWQRKINPDFSYLFIIGKGREYIDIRSAEDLQEARGNTLFVPSFGYPASDNLLVSDINKPTPLVSIGRLSAIIPGEVNLYLNKIRDMEAQLNVAQTIEAREWMKNIMHLGGGSTPSQQQTIRNNLKGIGSELEGGKFGAYITGFYKTSTDPIQTSLSDQIFERINKGLSVLTFFGHSSAGSFDFNIDNPDNYLNVAKYPLMLSLGCYSGNMYADFRSIGERFIFLENGGAGAFGASRGLGFIHSLNNFAQDFYWQMSNDYYGAPISDGLKASIANFEDRTDIAYGTLMEQFSLLGDPAFRLNAAPGPDFVFAADKTRFEPSIINAQKDSFEVSFVLYNIGQAVEDTIELTINRQFPSGEMAAPPIRMSIPTPTYRDKITLTLPTEGKRGIGINRFLVTANTSLSQSVTELPLPAAQLNNSLMSADGQAGIPFFIIDNSALPIWPPDYALVGNADITLKASTADAFAPDRTYFMELDTSPVFSQPLSQTTIVQKGGVIRWTPDFAWQDSTVYYWRITPDSLDIGTPTYVWEASSFTYINGIEAGWGQGHWGQWQNGTFDLLKLDEQRAFAFVKNLVNIRIKNKIWDNINRPGLVFNNESFAGSVRPWNYLNAGLAVVVYEADDPNGFWRNPPPGNIFQAGDYGVPTGNSRVFAFPTNTEAERSNLMVFLNDVVPEEAYVFIFSIIKQTNSDIGAQNWAQDSVSLGENIFQLLEQQGANLIRELETYGTIPYIFMYRKNLGVISESLSLNIEEEANTSFDLPITLTNGNYHSPSVGPAESWNTLNWSFESLADGEANELTLYAGNDVNNLDSIRFDTLAMSGSINLGELNIQEKNYLQLKWHSYDEVDRSPSPLNYWHITHQHLPDLAIDPATYYLQSNDSLTEGEVFLLSTAISNASDLDIIDSVQVKYSWQSGGEILRKDSITIPPLNADQSHTIAIELDTRGAKFSPQLILDVNPQERPRESTYINNSATLELNLKRDVIAPVIDVVFDGRKIFDGELISANPFIVVKIEDENLFIPLDNPALFDVRIVAPDGTGMLIDLNDPTVDFSFELTEKINQVQISFQPELNQDGFYRLQIKGKDSSNNPAGRLDYEIKFEVVLATQLSNILPYPNPFSNSTRFVYTLSGRESVSGVSIQIMTVSGRIVRHISSSELGPLEVGTHLTSFEWDGRDDYGSQLANGVYLYQVLSPPDQSTGEFIPAFANDTLDTFFKNGLGKIVLLR